MLGMVVIIESDFMMVVPQQSRPLCVVSVFRWVGSASTSVDMDLVKISFVVSSLLQPLAKLWAVEEPKTNNESMQDTFREHSQTMTEETLKELAC